MKKQGKRSRVRYQRINPHQPQVMHEIKVPILNDEYFVYVIWGDLKKCIAYINKVFGEHFEEDEFKNKKGKCFYSFYKHDCPLAPVIWLKESDEMVATLAHEAVHAMNETFEYIGETESSEVFAHSVGAIVRHVVKYKKHCTGK